MDKYVEMENLNDDETYDDDVYEIEGSLARKSVPRSEKSVVYSMQSEKSYTIDAVHEFKNLLEENVMAPYLPKPDIWEFIQGDLNIANPTRLPEMRTTSQITGTTTESASYASLDELVTPDSTTGFGFDGKSLSLFLTVSYACVLEECIEEVRLVGAIDRIPNLKTRIKYRTLADRFVKGKEKHNEFEDESFFYNSLDHRSALTYKIQQERLYAQIILKESLRGLLKKRNCGNLIKRIQEYIRSRKDEEDLFEEVRYNLQVLPKLRLLEEMEESSFKAAIQDTTERVGRLKDLLEDAIFLCKIKENYIDRWENSRNEQNRLRHQITENNLNKTIKEHTQKIIDEERVHWEMLEFLDQSKTEYEEQISYWQKEYDEELERRDNEILSLKIKRDLLISDLNDLQVLYQKRQNEIADYLEYKEEMRKQKVILDHKNKSATKIQAWWRMLMVRKGLGPYRKKKPKGKKKGPEKGKKGSGKKDTEKPGKKK